MIISDMAMVFILAPMKVFYGETTELFLRGASYIVNGKFQNKDAEKNFHLRAIHLMNYVKKILKKKKIHIMTTE